MRALSILLVLLLVAAGAFWVLLSDSGGDVRPLDELERVDDGAAPRADEVVGLDENSPAAVTPLVPAAIAAPPVDEQLPASYRRALGGITGRVVEEDGDPVVDIAIALAALDFYDVMPPMIMEGELAEADFDLTLAEVRTDEEGRFFIGELETRVGGGLIVDPGGPRTVVQILDQTPSTGQVLDIGDIVLIGGVTLRGRVIDVAGDPIPNARVRSLPSSLPFFPEEVVDFRTDGGVLVDTQEADIGMFTFRVPGALASLERLLPIPTTQTDADGNWELIGVPSGMPLLLYDHGDHVGRSQKLSPTGPPGTVVEVGEVPLEDGVTLVGRVVDERGDPVAGAEVMAGNRLTLGPVAVLKAPVVSDEEGRFMVDALRPSSAHAAARRNPQEDFVGSPMVQAGDEEAIVTLPSGRQLVLALVDEGGAALTDVTVRGRVLPDDDADDVPDFLITPRSLAGRWEVDDEDRVVFEELQAGYWDLSVAVDGYALHRELFDLRSADLSTTITLEPELGVDVLVVDAVTGEPVEHAWVVGKQSTRKRGFGDRAVSGTRSDDEGRARVAHLEEGEARIEVSHPALAVIDEEITVPYEGELIIELPAGGVVKGQVFEAGGPPSEPVMVALEQEGGGRSIELTKLPRTTVTDMEGFFEFTNVQPGEVELEVRERIGQINVTAPWEAFINSPLASAEAEVVSGEETEVVLVMGTGAEGMDTATVSGRILVNGRPEQGWTVRTWGKLRRSTQTGPDGSFDLGMVAAGSTQLMISPPGQSMMTGAGPTHVEELELAPNDSRWVEIEFETASVRGVVRDAQTGLPMRGVAVRARRTVQNDKAGWWGGRQGAAVTDADGYYELFDIQTGEFRMEAEADGYSRAASEAFTLRPGDMPNVDVLMSRGLIVTGRLQITGVDSEEEPRWMWLTAETDDGREVASRVSDGGEFQFSDMSEGDWTFTLLSSYDNEFETEVRRIGPGVDDVSLNFVAIVDEDAGELTPAVLIEEG